ncbi:spore gernimation protein [Mesobacillus campisalis]|uniref:Spore gernimation protein n=1 Tax=Mesobacillus campisalis TaxID=1408103 RepID=A0A0M2STY5_9BACI|nr:spore germination protein GerPE [Mesobacillus campisalis]KKK36437.1 spore gernimation protein [Mesobacillus campisalis]
MSGRTVHVDNVEVKSVSLASVLQIGDSNRIQGFSRALAVQRQAEIFFGNEGNFTSYRVFSEPLPLSPITEQVQMSRQYITPCIRIGKIGVTGVSASAVVHLGNTRHVSMEARVKHIRQLLPEPE